MGDGFEIRFVWLRALAMLILIVSICLLAVDIIGLFVSEGAASDFFAGAFPAMLLAVLGSAVFYGLVRVLIAIESQNQRINVSLDKANRQLGDITHALQLAGENILLSEEAKSIAFRKKDREALLIAIEEEVGKEDWESAFYLADQLDRLFGYRQEAIEMRNKVSQAQKDAQQSKLEMDLAKLKDLLAANDWEGAAKVIETLQQRYPDEPATQNLREMLEDHRLQHKKRLLQQWDEAVSRSDVDAGIEVLRKLDQYLTPNEVAALEESARGVFRAKLHNLGVQFSLLVAEKRWTEALEAGEEIINEFPNSRMAGEIRDRLDVLRNNAAAASAAAATQ